MPSVEADLTAKLQAGGEHDVMVTLGAPIATTALLAKETAGSDIEIATFDMNAEVAQHLADGDLAFIVDQQPYLQGYQAVDSIWLATYGSFQVGAGDLVLTGPAIASQAQAAEVVGHAALGVRGSGLAAERSLPLTTPTSASPGIEDDRKKSTSRFHDLMIRPEFGAVIAAIAMFAFFAFIAPVILQPSSISTVLYGARSEERRGGNGGRRRAARQRRRRR